MATHLEKNLQHAIDLIRDKVLEMARRDHRALMDCLAALEGRNRQIAYLVILRDRHIDELEKEIDRLCLEFLARQQPVAGPLRFAYATIKINLELERIGDYAESIARQVLKLIARNVEIPTASFVGIANRAVPMLDDAIRAFVTQDAELARKTMETEEEVDVLRNQINAELFQLREQNKIPLEAFTPLLTIARRFERVSDQAKNICEETLYMCTGEYNRHKGTEASRVIFVDHHNACRSQMAEAIANSLNQPRFEFASAGLEPTAITTTTVSFLKEKGLEISKQASKGLDQIPNLDHFQVVITLAPEAKTALQKAPAKAVCLDWNVPDPSQVEGTSAEITAAYESTFQFLRAHIDDLVKALLGDNLE